MKRSISRTELDRLTPEEIIRIYGEEALQLAILKSQTRHSSWRNLFRRKKTECAVKRQRRRGSKKVED